MMKMATSHSTEPAIASEHDLLADFVQKGDERAFETLVRRHHLMVLGVCRRILGDAHDVEDAFQATFVVLAKNARRIRNTRSLGSWLHGVAYRVSMRQFRERLLFRERSPVEPMIDDDSPLEKLARRSDEETVDEELRRLPHKYRCPLVLHYLEERTHEEIARELGLTLSAVGGRIRRGRAELRRRLLRRGITLAGFATIVVRSQQLVAAPVAEVLIRDTVGSSIAFLQGDATARLASHQLAQLESTNMMLSTTKGVSLAAAMLLALGLGGFGISRLVTAQSPRRVADTVTVDAGQQSDPDAIRAALVFGSEPAETELAELSDRNLSQMASLNATSVSRHRAAIERIEARLGNEQLTFAYVDQTLTDVVRDLQNRLEVPVLIDVRALEDYGIGVDTPITFTVQGISTRSALRLCLGELDLTYAIANEVILITTPEEAETMLDTRVYSIAETGMLSDKLTDLITETVLDDSWSAVGGPGEISAATPTTLVVAQTQEGHEHIVDLLQQLTRAARQK